MEILGVVEDREWGKILKVKFDFVNQSITHIPPCLDFEGERFWLHVIPDREGVCIYTLEVKK